MEGTPPDDGGTAGSVLAALSGASNLPEAPTFAGPHSQKRGSSRRAAPTPLGPPGQVVKPTGFYKVIFRPGRDGDADRAVAFLVPHTRDEMDLHYKNFIARIDVVERASGFIFAVPEALKGAGGQQWWLERLVPGNWQLRAKTCHIVRSRRSLS